MCKCIIFGEDKISIMVNVFTEIIIDKPLEAVANYAANPDNAPIWYVNIKAAEWQTPKPLKIGSQIAFKAIFVFFPHTSGVNPKLASRHSRSASTQSQSELNLHRNPSFSTHCRHAEKAKSNLVVELYNLSLSISESASDISTL